MYSSWVTENYRKGGSFFHVKIHNFQKKEYTLSPGTGTMYELKLHRFNSTLLLQFTLSVF